MAEEQIVTNIVANADFSKLIADVNKVTASLAKLQQEIIQSDTRLSNQVNNINRAFGDNLRRTGQFSTHFVTLASDVEKFGQNLDGGKLKLKQYFQTFQDHTKRSGGLIRQLAQQQVQMQNAILQPLGKNAQGMQQFNVHIPQGLDLIKNKTALAKQELQILNKVIQDGGNQLINWGKNTQWAGRQLTVGLTVPIAAFGKAAADAFKQADQELVRLTKVYGGLTATSATELSKVRKDVADTAKELAAAYGTSYTDTIALAADIAATGKQGNELLASTKETSRLAILGEVDRQDAMKATLAIQNTFKQNTDQLSESINFLNAVENQTSTSLGDLIEAIPKAGPVIQGMGGSVKDLALYLTAMKEGGINATEGANALKSSIASLINPTKVAKEMFSGFGIDLGGLVTKNAGNLTATILELQASLDKLNPLQKQQAIEQLFGKFQFARMNALFTNLGKQGSQTLQVLDLMKASSQDLADVAGRELSQVTESASGKYKRAIESLKADLASVGEEFLKINTSVIKVLDGVIKFFNKLPDPIKQALTFIGGITALAGPMIMLTGVLANFFGYIIKGAAHFKSLFKGGEGWKMLTPEILAAQKAGSLVEATFYSDAKAALALETAVRGLVNEFSILEQKAKAGAISINPALQAMAGNVGIAMERQVNPNHPLLSPTDTRSMSHLNPVAGMTTDQKATQTLFGVVPGAPKVNQKISNAPQMYATGDLPNIPGLTTAGGVSTGIVAAEAAKWHAMTGALAMQSEAEIKLLKKEVSATGLITSELSASYQSLLPTITQLTTNAASESAAIVAELQASKITVDQARAKIIALNAQVEASIGQAVTSIAAQQGRSVNITNVPLLNQPIVDTKTGKSNMKELFRPGRTREVLNKIAKGLGVKTFGAPYSTETTIPKRFAKGGTVYRAGGSTGPEFTPMGTDTVPAMLTPGEFVVKAGAVNKDTLPFLKALNEGASSRPFLSATMIHQGTEANQALAGNRPNVALTGNYLANDLSSLHSRGLHPMALFYEQGVRLGYDKAQLKTALNAAYQELTGTFKNKGNTPINNAYYEKVASSIALKHLKTVSRFSPTIGRQVRLAEELVMMGHQRNVSDKGILPGSLRTHGFDGVSLPRHLVGTGSGFSGQANQTHFNLAQELYDEAPSNKYTGSLGRGNTISQVFGSQRGHIGVKFAPSKLNLMMGMIKNKIGRAPIAQSAQSIALTNKWRRGYSNGGLVGGTQYLHNGGFAEGFQSQRQKGFVGQGLMSRGGGDGLGMPAQMGIMMGGSAVGSMVGGGAGTAIATAANILPWLPLQKMLPSLKIALTNMKTFSGAASLAGKAMGMAFRVGPIGAVTTALWLGVKIFKQWQKEIADTRREHEMLNGITEKGAKEAGIKYNNVSNSIKSVNEQLKLQKDKTKAALEAYKSSGVSGLTLTIKELKELKSSVKTTMPEILNTFNSIDSSQINDLATNLKAQFVAGGMSVQEATNKIYALISVSNKANKALSAISQEGFTQIVDKSSAAQASVSLLAKNLDNVNSIDSKAFASNIDSVIGSLDNAVNSLIGTKDATGATINEATALSMQFEKMAKANTLNKQLSGDVLIALQKERPEFAAILNKADSIGGMYAKWRLLLKGTYTDLQNISSQQAMGLAAYQEALTTAADAAKTNTTSGALSSSAAAAKKLADKVKAGQKASAAASSAEVGLKKAEIKAINDKIKSINAEAEAKKKALQAALDSGNAELDIQAAQLDYQQAIARGDRDAAAQAQIRIQQLTKEAQTSKAIQAIEDNRQKQVDAQQAILDKDQTKKDAATTKTTGNATSLSNDQANLASIQSFQNQLADLMVKQAATDKITNKDKKAAAQKDIDDKLFILLKDLEKTNKVVQAAFPEYIADGKAKSLSEAKTINFRRGGGSVDLPAGAARTAFEQGSSAISKEAEAAFKAMSTAITGGATLQSVVDAINGKKTPLTLNVDSKKGTINGGKTFAEDLKEFGLNPASLNKSDTGSRLIDNIIQTQKLQKGDKFVIGGYQYNVTTGYDSRLTLGGGNAVSAGPVKKAGGGRVVPGVPYTINDGGKTEGIKFDMPGNIFPNANTMPRYNIPSNTITGMNGGGNTNSFNNTYAINIALNGTNVTMDDAVKRMKMEMALLNAKEGRDKKVGGMV